MPYQWKGFEAIMGGGLPQHLGLGVRGGTRVLQTEENAQVGDTRCSFGINVNVCAWEVAISFMSKLTGNKTQLSKHPPDSWQPWLYSDLLENSMCVCVCGGGLSGRHMAGSSPQSQWETSWTHWGRHTAGASGLLTEASTFGKLLLPHSHLFGLWPTPHSMCSVTYDMNLLTKVMPDQNGIPESSCQQQVLTDLDEVFSNVTTLKKRC